MEWLPERLEELGKTGADLAKALGLRNKQRAYALWNPDKKTGKTRQIKMPEVPKLAHFLEWTIEELLMKMGAPAAFARHGTVISGAETHTVAEDISLRGGLQFRSARAEQRRQDGFMLHGDGTGTVIPTLFYMKVIDDKNEPVYRLRDKLTIDPGYPIIIGEDCVFSTDEWPPSGGFCVIARLLRNTVDSWFCRSIAGLEEFELDRAEFKNAWPIVQRTRPA